MKNYCYSGEYRTTYLFCIQVRYTVFLLQKTKLFSLQFSCYEQFYFNALSLFCYEVVRTVFSVFSDFLVLVFRSKIFLYNFFFNSTRRIVLHLENKFANFSTMLLFQYLPALRRGFLLACNNVIISGMIAFSVVAESPLFYVAPASAPEVLGPRADSGSDQIGSVPDNKICNFKLWKS